MDRMAYYSYTGEKLTDFSLFPLIEQVGQRPYPVARSELQQMLLNALGQDTVRLGAKCVAVEQDKTSATAIFEDGSRATGDVLIAADGTHSVIRPYVVGHPVDRRYVGYVNWNGLLPATEDLAPKTSWVIYVGENKRASLMPIGAVASISFWMCPFKGRSAGTW